MKNYEKHLNDLKCIKVKHTYEGNTINTMLSFNQFYISFVDERWTGERRTNKQHTMFGYWHTKTTVTNPYNNEKSIRVFTFPKNEAEARELDYNYYRSLEQEGY